MLLHGFPGTRTKRIRWLLEELGVDYEYREVDVRKGAHKSPDFLRLHPHGRVPVLEDGELRFIESCAALLYLADKYPEKGLAPALGDPERGRYYQFMVYAAATLDTPSVQTYFHSVLFPAERRNSAVVAEHAPGLAIAVAVIDQALTGRPHLCGEKFSAADVAIGYALDLVDQCGGLTGSDNARAYIARLRDRPAYQAANG